jgi:hypothetical protein
MVWRWDVIGDLVRRHSLRVGAEIGVAEGRFAAGLLAQCPDVKLWCFDDYGPGYKTWMGTTWTDEQQRRNRGQAKGIEVYYKPRMTLIEKTSIDAAAWLAGAQLDFVFIDADHSYEAVKADIAAWRERIRPGGWLTGHDYDRNKFPGVVAAVDEAFPGAEKREDYTWLMQL